jgi:hypothetical protein
VSKRATILRCGSSPLPHSGRPRTVIATPSAAMLPTTGGIPVLHYAESRLTRILVETEMKHVTACQGGQLDVGREGTARIARYVVFNQTV